MGDNTTKTCTACFQDKPLDTFGKCRRGKYGHRADCKSCCVSKRKAYETANSSLIKQRRKDNREQDREKLRRWRAANPEKCRVQARLDGVRKRARYPEKCRELDRVKRKKYGDAYRKYFRDYHRKRRAVDLQFKLTSACRHRIYLALKGSNKSIKTLDLLGCSVDELRTHIEQQFKPGMTWDNWSRDGWHLDHIIPLAWFELADPCQLKRACHYTNLQPMWAVENYKKNACIY